MASTAAQMRVYNGAAFFSFGFRPFFLCGAIVAATAPVVTALVLSGAISFDSPVGMIAWHSHEMIYGYLAAVVAGFVLTAVPNWTGRLPMMGAPLMMLFALWLAGRVAMAAAPGAWAAAIIDGAFLLVMDLILWREVLAGKNWRNLPVCMLIGLFAVGNIVWHAGVLTSVGGALGFRWGVAVIAVLLGLIGGRVTPSFTRNWLAKNGGKPIDAAFGLMDKAAVAGSVLAAAAWIAAPGFPGTGALLAIAAGLHFVRLVRWGGWRTHREPLVLILHVGYFWLALAFAFLSFSVFDPALVSRSTAIHALTAGAAGVMTLAVMTRATLGHTGRALTADSATIAIYGLVNLGAALRLSASFFPQYYTTVISAAGAVWGAAFVLFAVVYGRYLIEPRQSS